MKKFSRPALMALFLAMPAVCQEPATRSAREIADQLWADFQKAEWDRPVRNWTGSGTSGTGLECQEFHGDSFDHAVDDQWSYRCTRAGPTHQSEWSFYALTLNEPLACRLEQFRATVAGVPPATLDAIHQDLSGRFNERYGPGEQQKSKGGGLGESGSADWRNVLRWAKDDVQVYLYTSEPPGKAPAVGLLARHRLLLDAIAAEKKRPYWFKFGPWLEHWSMPLDRRLVEELGADFPAVPNLLLKESEYPSAAAVQKERKETLDKLLAAIAKAPAQRRPALLLAADRLAGRAHDGETSATGSGEIHENIAGFDLVYEWNHLGDNWAYQRNLLWRVWQEYSATEWGEMAFLVLLNHGWNTRVGCAQGEGQFREVIRQAEAFLSDHPKSRYRPEVEFALAQAFETWWSASQASAQDSYSDRTLYLEGSANAREQAIRHYEEVLRLAPEGYEAGYARQQLPRLKLGLDTNQRRFFCIYD